MRRILVGLLAMMSGLTAACGNADGGSGGKPMDMTGAELIVLAAPVSDDPYYADVAPQIREFHLEFADIIVASGDEVIILADETAAPHYRERLGGERVLVAPQADIWARDFGLSNIVAPVMFRYTAEGQGGGLLGQNEADAVQDDLAALAEAAGLAFTSSDWLNDGGNWVDDGAGSAVVSRKFLIDNDVSEAEAKALLRAQTGVEHVAFIDADEQGGLEHADGVVAFVGPNTLVINSYDEDPDYAAALRSDLEAGLPGASIHEIITPYDGSRIYDERFGSACGLYTNALVTANRMYLPQFGIAEDEIALAQVRAATDLEVVPVRSDSVCFMGGGVRCMSWQLRGENAERLLAYAAAQAN